MSTPTSPITELLRRCASGDTEAHGELWKQVYADLKRVAASQLAAEPSGRLLQPTALVAEVYLRLTGAEGLSLVNRKQFFATAAKVMRQIRVDDARMRKRTKRGGGVVPLSLDAGAERRSAVADNLACLDPDPERMLQLDDALDRLESIDPRAAQVVALRYYAGLTREDTAEILGVSPRTVDNLWSFARAWLHREVCDEE